MSKAKFEAARELIREKKYSQARALLKTIDHPQARQWEAKLDALDPPEPDIVVDDLPKSKKKQRSPLARYLSVLALLIASVVLVLVYMNLRQTTEAAKEDALRGLDARSTQISTFATLSVFCSNGLKLPETDCDTWARSVTDINPPGAEFCATYVDWIMADLGKEQMGFCLLGHGINPFSDVPIRKLDLSILNDADFAAVVPIVDYCETKGRNHAYCSAWAMLVYHTDRDKTNLCAGVATYNRCMEDQGLAPT